MAATEAMELTATSNPYLDFYNEFCTTRKQDLFKVFDPSISEKKRRKMYKQLDVSVAMKYAWAIPDERALQIIKHYGPIVEIGAGTGYWGRLLQLRGVDIICYDIHTADDDEDKEEEVEDDGEEGGGEEEEEDDDDDGEQESGDDGNDEGDEQEEDEGEGQGEDESDEEVEVEQIYWMDVRKGTPKVLRNHSDRTLFLCYPDDFDESSESMALQALQNYSGDCVIHVGEMFGQALCLPGPWGRTSASEFQTHLASVYHKVLQVPLPSWHSSIDTLTVWKRTKTSMMDNCFYAYIPEDERLDLVQACPSTRHLLNVPGSSSSDKPPTKRKADATKDHATKDHAKTTDYQKAGKKKKKNRN